MWIKGNFLQIQVFRSEQSLEILLDNYHPVKWVEETIKCKSISDTHRTMKLVSFKTLENKEERTHILSNCLLCKKKLKQGAHKKKLGWKLHMDFISYLSIYSSFLNSKKETNGWIIFRNKRRSTCALMEVKPRLVSIFGCFELKWTLYKAIRSVNEMSSLCILFKELWQTLMKIKGWTGTSKKHALKFSSIEVIRYHFLKALSSENNSRKLFYPVISSNYFLFLMFLRKRKNNILLLFMREKRP